MFQDDYGLDFNSMQIDPSLMPTSMMGGNNPMETPNPMSGPKSAHPMYVMKSGSSEKPSYEQVVSQAYGTKPKGYDAWAPIVNDTIGNLFAYGIGGRRGLSRNLASESEINAQKQREAAARQRMFEANPLNERSYFESTRGNDFSLGDFTDKLNAGFQREDMKTFNTPSERHMLENPTENADSFAQWDIQNKAKAAEAEAIAKYPTQANLYRISAGLRPTGYETTHITQPAPKEPTGFKGLGNKLGISNYPSVPQPAKTETSRQQYLYNEDTMPSPENMAPLPLGTRPLNQVNPFNPGVITPEAQEAINFIKAKAGRLTPNNVQLLKSKYGLSDDYLVQQGIMNR